MASFFMKSCKGFYLKRPWLILWWNLKPQIFLTSSKTKSKKIWRLIMNRIQEETQKNEIIYRILRRICSMKFKIGFSRICHKCPIGARWIIIFYFFLMVSLMYPFFKDFKVVYLTNSIKWTLVHINCNWLENIMARES